MKILYVTLLFWLMMGICSAQPNLMGSSDSSSSANPRRDDSPGIKELFSTIGRVGTENLREFLGVNLSKGFEWDSNESPRHSLFTFNAGMDDILRNGSTSYQRVTQTLPEGYAHESAEAMALKQVLDRLGPMNPLNVPDTSTTSSEPSIQRFEVFPYGLDHEWIWERLDGHPNGEIVLIYDQESDRWIFSEETLKQAPALLESIRSIPPVYPEDGNRDFLKSVFQPMAEGTPWWGWVIFCICLVAAVLVGNFVKHQLMIAGNILETKTRPVVGSILRSIGISVGILSGTILIILGSSFVHFTQIFSNMYWEVIEGVLLIAFLWTILGATDLISTLVKTRIMQKNHDEYGAMTVTIVHRVVNTLLYTVLAIFLLENVFSMNIGALITGLGIVGLALSLAGKESAQNLFGAISIFTNRPFVVGDWVNFKGNLGEVEDVRMQATNIRLLSGEMLIVPNMQFVSNEVENLEMRKFLRREMNIALPYGTPPNKVREALDVLTELFERDDVVKEGNFNVEERPASITFSDFGEYYLNLKVYYWYFIGEKGKQLQREHERGWFSYLNHCTMVNQAILEAFDAHDIEFAFPTQTLELEKKKPVEPQDS